MQVAMYALALVTTIVVVVLSLGNGVQLPQGWLTFAHLDKLQHALAYAALGFLWWQALRQKPRIRLGWTLWFGLFCLGALLEVMQWAFYPQRYFEFADMLANGVGAGIGILLASWISRTFHPSTYL